jgi:ABC-type dipeptide/oligopeptide/nickel transport system permease subunit
VTPDEPRPRTPASRRRNLPLVLGGGIVAFVALAAAVAPALSALVGLDPYEQVAPRHLTPPTPPDRDHLLGTDGMGRDQMSRLLFGARLSLATALLAQALALAAGVLVGALAGWNGGVVDSLLMRATDLMLALPAPLVALAVAAAVPEPEAAPLLMLFPEPSLALVLLVLGGLGWAAIARLVRAEIMRLRAEEYARAATASGASGVRVVMRHLLPNAAGPIFVAASLGLGGNILMEAWLSFLGVGARPPLPSWGTMVAEGQAHLLTRPWVCLVPGLAILVAVLGFNLLGDGMRDRLDPTLRRSPA